MAGVNNILALDQLYDISNFLGEKAYDKGNITVVIGVPDIKTINRVNADYFYRTQENSGNITLDEVEEVRINIGNVHFVYKVDGNRQE